MTRRLSLLLALALIALGLLWRLVPWGLPLWAHHYGGGVLWGAMLFMLMFALRPSGWNVSGCLLAACLFATGIELSRLVHTPALDRFRMTLSGQLLLGHIFSPWNILVDVIGVAVAAYIVRKLVDDALVEHP